MSKLNLIKLFEANQVSFFPIYLMDLAATYSVKKILGTSCKRVISFYQGTDVEMYAEKDSWQKMCNFAQKRLIENNLFYKKVRQEMIRECKNLERFSNQLMEIRPKILTNRELIKIYHEFEKKTLALRIYAWIPNFVDMGSKSIFDIAEEKIEKQRGVDPKIKEYISKLTTPTEITRQRQHELDLYKIQFKIQKNKNWQKSNKISKEIEKHVKKYGWLSYYYLGPGWNNDDIVKILKNNLKLIKNPQEKIKEINNYKKNINNDKRILAKKLRLKKETLLLLDKIAAMIFLKTYRKEFLIYSNYCFEPVLREIGRRLGFSLFETRFVTPREIHNYLLNKNLLTTKIKKQIKERFKKGCVSIAEKDKIKILAINEGRKIIKLIEKIKKESEIKTTQIRGNCAYPGKASGIARLINLRKEVEKIKKGEILVSRATNPDLNIAMQKADAFVTDEGGITCHAAIVAREMKKPCIIGTKNATKLIKDGDLVEIDASKGIVIILKKTNK
ncbi:MAG: PEP-utilizing enzyme [Patescibacteria group bacterium]